MTEADELRTYDRLVQVVVRRFIRRLPPNVLRDDLEAAGRLGLLLALRRTTRRDVHFDAYAFTRIRCAILDELRVEDWAPRRRGRYAGENAPSVFVTDDFGDRFAHNPTDAIDRRLDLERVCSKLPERQRHIIESYYGHEALFREIGTDLGVSEMRISQLHAETLLRMRDVFTD